MRSGRTPGLSIVRCVVEQAKRFTKGILQAKLSWAAYFRGQWSEPQSTQLDESIQVVVPNAGLDTNNVFIHITKETAAPGEEPTDSAIRIHLSGPNFSNRGEVSPYSLFLDADSCHPVTNSKDQVVEFNCDNTGYRLFSKNSPPTVIGRSNAPEYTYRLATAEINLRKGSQSLDLDVDEYASLLITGDRPSTVRISTPHILEKGLDFHLQVCPRGADLRPGERESPLSPFFYWDEEHLFFARPFAEPRLVTEHEEDLNRDLSPWSFDQKAPELVEQQPDKEPFVNVVYEPPPELDIPLDIPGGLSEESNYGTRDGIDWMLNPATVLDYQGCAIGEHGGVEYADGLERWSHTDDGQVVIGKEGLSPKAAARLGTVLSDKGWLNAMSGSHRNHY